MLHRSRDTQLLSLEVPHSSCEYHSQLREEHGMEKGEPGMNTCLYTRWLFLFNTPWEGYIFFSVL